MGKHSVAKQSRSVRPLLASIAVTTSVITGSIYLIPQTTIAVPIAALPAYISAPTTTATTLRSTPVSTPAPTPAPSTTIDTTAVTTEPPVRVAESVIESQVATTTPEPTTTTETTTTARRSAPTSTTTRSPTTTTRRPTPAPAPAIAAVTTCGNLSFNGVKPGVREAGNFLKERFNVSDVGGVAGRANASDHPKGLALDFMVNRSTGDELAVYALDNQTRFGITYVIWRQRINYGKGDGWELMEDRGGATANHFDHVHISFSSSASFEC